MDAVIKLIMRTLVRGEVYRVIRRTKGRTSLVLAVLAAVVLVVMQGHR